MKITKIERMEEDKIVVTQRKICPDCKKNKLLSFYSKDKNRKDGLCCYCKDCITKRIIKIKQKKNPNYKSYSEQLKERKGNGIDYIITSCGNKCYVDRENYEMISKYLWGESHGYAFTSIPKTSKKVLMHRMIMEPDTKNIVDHINGNPLDNRKSNLRLCKKQDNCRHRVKLSKNNTTGFNGIFIDKRRKNKYVAQINTNGKGIHIGCFRNINDAIHARRRTEEEYFGEFKPTIREVLI